MRDIRVIADGALLIRDGYVHQAGPTRRVERLLEARGAEVIEAAGRVIIPGFVDGFTRLLCGPARHETEAELQPLESSRRAFRGYSVQRMEMEAAKRLRHFLYNGTTTLGASCGYGLDDQTEIRALRVMDRLDGDPLGVVPHFYGACACPGEMQDRPESYLERLATEVLPAIAHRKLARSVVVSDAFPAEAAAGYLACARKLGFRTVVDTRSTALPVALDHRADVLCGIESLSGDDVGAVAASPAIAMMLPGRVFYRGLSLFPNCRALIDAGAALALGTGFDHLESPSFSMPMAMSMACSQMGVTPAEAVTAATINAAYALGLGDSHGSLEPGKQADLLILDCADYREIPLYFGVNLVEQVFRAGRVIHARPPERSAIVGELSA
jgi:imidazolonepropionase